MNDDFNADDIFETMDEIVSAGGTEFRTLKAWGGKAARIGSLTAGQLINFLNNNDDPAKRRMNGLILIAQSLVDKAGKRLVDTKDNEAMSKAIDQLKDKDAKVNATLVEKILELNGLNKKDAKEIAKNVSGEANTDASPTD
jgi:hypothetical protein